jgi:hypothetical protein
MNERGNRVRVTEQEVREITLASEGPGATV